MFGGTVARGSMYKTEAKPVGFVLGGMALDRPPRPPRVGTLLGTTPAWVDHVVGGVA